ncbi:MAG TPA: hypothetical protein PKA41_19980 [Verrucomicrobiota bacterium]|nr:hypothetical protein [Verrucomicrobiota bacterium]
MRKQNNRSQSKFHYAAVVLAFSVAIASAHPGHSLHDESVAHALTSPYHLLTLALIGAGLLLGGLFVKRLTARRTLQITGVAAVAVAAVTFVSQHLS